MRKIILIIGVALGVLVAAGTFFYIQSTRPRFVDVPVAAENIPAGTVLRPELFREVRIANVDSDTASKWVLTSEFGEMALGHTATSDIKEGFPAAKAQMDPNSADGFESRLSLAISGTNDYYVVIPTTPDQVGNYVQPGDRIDLIVSIGAGGQSDSFSSAMTPTLRADANGSITLTNLLPVSKLVMQNMKVLRVEREPSRNSQSSKSSPEEVRDVKRLYVKVDRDQLEVLGFVLNNGTKNIAVRAAGGSQDVLATDGVTWDDFTRWFYAQRGNGMVQVQPFSAVGPYTPAASAAPAATPNPAPNTDTSTEATTQAGAQANTTASKAPATATEGQ